MGTGAELQEKYGNLVQYLRELQSVAVAFSGGVDSTFLLRAAHDALGDKVLAVTADLCSTPEREFREAEELCRREGVRQMVCRLDELSIDGFAANPPNRCYLCKKAIFGKILETAKEQGMACVAEGSNVDDMGDYRPGLAAIAELGVRSPLRETGFTKAEIRRMSRELSLPTWEKPSYACLASRFAYGETITREKLSMVERAEQLLLDCGFHQMRVRLHGSMARIELLPDEMEKLFAGNVRKDIAERFKEYGFSYVTVDLQGFRSGSMNEGLSQK